MLSVQTATRLRVGALGPNPTGLAPHEFGLTMPSRGIGGDVAQESVSETRLATLDARQTPVIFEGFREAPPNGC